MSEIIEETKIDEKKKNSPQRKTKEQIKRERALNASMVILSKKNQDQLGIISVQPEKNIFFLSSRMFVKVYTLKGVELTDNRKKTLVSALCSFSKHRMRLSSFSYKNSRSPLVFLTVFFPGNSYAAVADEIDDFDRMLSTLMEDKFKIQFVTCNMGDVFMFIYMNFNGQMKKITSKTVMKKSINLKKNFFQDIKEVEGGYFINKNGKLGCTYICTQFPDEMESPFTNLRKLGCAYLSCIDFQVLDKYYVSYFNRTLEESYNSKIEDNVENMINLTFILNMIYDSEKEQETCEELVSHILFEKGLIAAPGIGVQEKIVDSIASFGLFDFHCSKNVNFDIVSKLFG